MALELTGGDNILDLVLSNAPDCVYDVHVGEPFSVHNTVSFKINLNPYRQKRANKQFYNFKQADWSHFNELFDNISYCVFLTDDKNNSGELMLT